jgi:hypothetical protein
VGFIYYGSNEYPVEVDDRALAHLKMAVLSLLRAGRSVAFSFTNPTAVGGGRETLWISPTTDLRFKFLGGRPPRINPEWVRLMIESANEPTGMHLMEEPVHSQNSRSA